MKKVKILVGSLRNKAYSKRLAKNIIKMFPDNFAVEIVEIKDLPLYNFDYDDPNEPDVILPESYKNFRAKIKEADGIFFVTPENNRLIPACLKNAIDICSKPNNDVAFNKKPIGVVSHSIGKMGGYSSQKSLKLALSYFNPIFLDQPEVFIGNSNNLFDGDDDKITDSSTYDFIKSYIDRYVKLVQEN